MASNGSIIQDQEAFQCLVEISSLLNTGLDEQTLRCCVQLCEQGINPESLALIVKELKRQVSLTPQTNNSINNNSL